MSPGAETLLDLSLSRGTLHRSLADRHDPTVLQRVLADAGTKVVDLVGLKARTCRVDGALRLVLRAPGYTDTATSAMFLGRDGAGTPYVAVMQEADRAAGGPDGGPGDGPGWLTLRDAGAELTDTDAGVFTSAVALAQWHARHPRCPRCGTPTVPEHGGWLRRCPQDDSEHHPRTDAAVIVAVTDAQERILLARGPGWPAGRMSLLAGFVEAGESLESAARREVAEEVGVDIGELSYRGNQPWPFPSSLMVGFTGRAAGTELTLDPEEILEAAWFTRGELNWAIRAGELALPNRVSIARRLIEEWFGGEITEGQEVSGPFRGTES